MFFNIFSLLEKSNSEIKHLTGKPHLKYSTKPISEVYLSPNREQLLKRLKNECFDVLVIGGGCVGTGVALDATLRGMKTALVEINDFGSGTSGRSGKLIHGGVRYLETAFKKMDWGAWELVKEALEERCFMLQTASYMNKPIPVMIPLYSWWEVPYMFLGAKIYDALAGEKRSVPPSYYLSAESTLYEFPILKTEGLKGSVVYYDGVMNDARLNCIIALTSLREGAVVSNHIGVVGILKDARGFVSGAKVRDMMSGEEWDVSARSVVNATGSFSDKIRKMDDSDAPELVVPAAGAFLMLPEHFSPNQMAMAIPKTTDDRVLFIMPWEGGTIVGTTDSESEISMLPKPSVKDIQFIMQESNRYLGTDARISKKDVLAVWSGLRPLVRDPQKLKFGGTQALSRKHVIHVSSSKLISVMGGKWTTYRRMAEDTMNTCLKIYPELSSDKSVLCKSVTVEMKLLGSEHLNVSYNHIHTVLRQQYSLSEDIVSHLVSNYGTRAIKIGSILDENRFNTSDTFGAKRLVSQYPFLEAEVVMAVQEECAIKLTDVLAWRLRLAFKDTKATRKCAKRAADIMGKMLEWSEKRKEKEVLELEELLKTMEMSNAHTT